MIDAERILKEYEKQGYLVKKTLHEEFEETTVRWADNTALIDKESKISYAELSDYSEVIGGFFLEQGLKKGDTVLLQLPNCILYVSVLLGLFKAGIVPALMLPTHREKEVISVANTIHPKAYIGTCDYMGFNYVEMVTGIDDLSFALEHIFSDKEFATDGSIHCRQLPDRGMYPKKEVDLNSQVDSRDIALFLLSGGTTNIPKVIPRVHEAYAYNSKAAAKRCEVTDDTVYMAVLSTSHDYPLASPGVFGTLFNGGTVVLCETSSFDENFEAIEKYKVTLTAIVPAIAKVWAEVLEWYEGDFSSLKQIIIGAAKLDRNIGLKIIERMQITIQQAYGLGEGITCCTKLDDDMETVLGTQGTPVSEADVIKIVDVEGNALGPYEAGELLEKGPYTFLGYYGNEKLNEDLFTEDEFLRTGDMAYLDGAGNVVICGRIKEQINRAGENVVPVEIETLLREHPDIQDAAVFGRPDENLGERTTAVIISDNKDLSLADVARFFIDNGVARYKIPDELHIRDELIYTNVGKVDKKKLKKILEENEQGEY